MVGQSYRPNRGVEGNEYQMGQEPSISTDQRAARELQLQQLAASYEDAAVYAVNPQGSAFVDLPEDIQRQFAWVLSADNPIELMAVPFRTNGIALFSACLRDGVAVGPVRMADEPEKTVELHLFNMGDRVVGAVVDPALQIQAANPAPAAASVMPGAPVASEPVDAAATAAPTAPVVPPTPVAPVVPPVLAAPVVPPVPTAPVAPPTPTAPVAPPTPVAPVVPPVLAAPVAPPTPTAPVAPPVPTTPVSAPVPSAPVPTAPVAPAVPPVLAAPVAPTPPPVPKAVPVPVEPVVAAPVAPHPDVPEAPAMSEVPARPDTPATGTPPAGVPSVAGAVPPVVAPPAADAPNVPGVPTVPDVPAAAESAASPVAPPVAPRPRSVLAPPPPLQPRPASGPAEDAWTGNEEDAADPIGSIDATAIYPTQADRIQPYLDSAPVVTVPPVVPVAPPLVPPVVMPEAAEPATEAHTPAALAPVVPAPVVPAPVTPAPAASAPVVEEAAVPVVPAPVAPAQDASAPVTPAIVPAPEVPASEAVAAPVAPAPVVPIPPVAPTTPASVPVDPTPPPAPAVPTAPVSPVSMTAAVGDQVFVDRRRVVLDTGPRIDALIGWSRGELIGRAFTDFMHPDDIEDGQASWNELVSSSDTVRTIRNRYWHRDGRWVWVDQTDTNLLSDPSVAAVVTTLVDVTDQMVGYAPDAQEARDVSASPAAPVPQTAPDGHTSGSITRSAATASQTTTEPSASLLAPVAAGAGVAGVATASVVAPEQRDHGMSVLHNDAWIWIDESGSTIEVGAGWQERVGMRSSAELRDFRNVMQPREDFDRALLAATNDRVHSSLRASMPRREDVSLEFVPIDDGHGPSVFVRAIGAAQVATAIVPEDEAVPQGVDPTVVSSDVPTIDLSATAPPNTSDVTIPDVDAVKLDAPSGSSGAIKAGVAGVAAGGAAATAKMEMPSAQMPSAPAMPSAPQMPTAKVPVTAPVQPVEAISAKVIQAAPAARTVAEPPVEEAPSVTMPKVEPWSPPALPAESSSVSRPMDPPRSRFALPSVSPVVNDADVKAPFGWKQLLGLCLILALAGVMRIWDLDTLPSGLSVTEAVSGLEGERVLNDGWIGIYSAEDHGHAAGPYYASALGVAAFGNSIFGIRLVSAIVGIATVAALYFIARRFYGPSAGFGAAAGLALFNLHIHFSRIAFTDIWWPLIGLLALGALGRAAHRGKRRNSGSWAETGWWLVAGLLAGFGVYANRAHWVFLIVALILAWAWLVLGGRTRDSFFNVTLFSLVAALVAAPMGLWLSDDSTTGNGLFELGARGRGEWTEEGFGGKVAQLFSWYAESWDSFLFDPRTDITNGTGIIRAVPIIILLLAVAGLVIMVAQHAQPMSWFVLGAVALLPFGQALINDAGVDRMLVLVPLLALAFGVAFGFIYDMFAKQHFALGMIAGAVIIGALGYTSWINYFDTFRNSSDQQWQFNTGLTEAMQVVDDFADENGETPYVNLMSQRYRADFAVQRFVVDDLQSRDAEGSLDLAPVEGDQVFVMTGEQVNLVEDFGRRYPTGRTLTQTAAGDPQAFAVYLVPGA